VRNRLERYLEIATGLTGVTAATAERVVARLVKEGEVAADRAEHTVQELLAASQRNTDAVTRLVREEVERAVDRLDLASMMDLERLEERVLSRLRSTDAAGTAEEAGTGQSAPSVMPDPTPEPTRTTAPVRKPAPSEEAVAPETAGTAENDPAGTAEKDQSRER
jgi:polyhydroxyalkanoate synthesis regulator phasin